MQHQLPLPPLHKLSGQSLQGRLRPALTPHWLDEQCMQTRSGLHDALLSSARCQIQCHIRRHFVCGGLPLQCTEHAACASKSLTPFCKLDTGTCVVSDAAREQP